MAMAEKGRAVDTEFVVRRVNARIDGLKRLVQEAAYQSPVAKEAHGIESIDFLLKRHERSSEGFRKTLMEVISKSTVVQKDTKTIDIAYRDLSMYASACHELTDNIEKAKDLNGLEKAFWSFVDTLGPGSLGRHMREREGRMNNLAFDASMRD